MTRIELQVLADFQLHASRAFFASAWADMVEENGTALHGEIMDQMPKVIDPAAITAARTLYMDIERANGKSIFELMQTVEHQGKGDRSNTVEMFGHYAAMQAMGHGVGLYDAFGSLVHDLLKIPYVEFSSCSLEKDYVC